MEQKYEKMRLFWAAAAVMFLVDQASKLVVVQMLDLKSLGVIPVLSPLLEFRMAWNRGVNFGLFANDTAVMRWVLIGISLLISLWLVRWSRRLPSPLARLSAGLVVGGALGNALDRLFYGAVADFLNVSCCGLNNPFAFNLADVSVFLGAIGLLLTSNRTKDEL